MPEIIDLRSDTVTRPTPEMRKAMAEAEVGDDILRDDPTVLRLEELAAELLGMEASMFTASGTMSNEIAVAVMTRPGDEVLVHADSHIYNLETGALAALAGVQPRIVADENGSYDISSLEKTIAKQGVQLARHSLLCLENSFHLNRGLALAADVYAGAAAAAHRAGMGVFMDGARIFNSAAALAVDVKELLKDCDAAAFCLCKGLAAPMGSILAGSRSFIDEARRIKQRFGGGWRQAGVVAAPAVIALEKMAGRLSEDHENAENLRRGMEGLGMRVDRGGVLTNIVNLDVSPRITGAAELAGALLDRSIKVKVCDETRIRMVTHNDVSGEHVNRVIQAVSEVLEK
jgi:threonine aldolase